MHKSVRDDRSLALNCDFVNRSAVSKVYFPAVEGVPEHFAHSDGVGRDSFHNLAPGCLVFLAPGKSEKLYDTCAEVSPAR